MSTLTQVLDREVDTSISRLAVVAGPDAGEQHAFTAARVTIGSADRATLTLTDPTVSAIHAELVRDGETVRLRDLGSKNGTRVSGHRVYDLELLPGTRFEVGGTTLEASVERMRLPMPVWSGPDRFGDLHGASPRMHALFAELTKIVDTDARVLIVGESGTGKELIARALHELGPRQRGPFVVVDGAALSSQLALAELFGHVPGAFTGADRMRIGAFERASGGTLFLDEAAELTPEVQAALLRAVEAGTVRRLGDNEHRAVDVRVIAATHRPLERMINEGTFREDLFYRLAEITVELPPLRRRASDIPRIAEVLAERIRPGDPDARALVLRELATREGYAWPGNVRELRNFVRRVLALGESGPPLSAHDEAVEMPVRTDVGYGDAKELVVRLFERRYFRRLLDEAAGSVSEVARRAGLSRTYVYKVMERSGLR